MNFGTFGFPKKKISEAASAASDAAGGVGTLTLTAAADIQAGDLVGYGDVGVVAFPHMPTAMSVASSAGFVSNIKASPTSTGALGARSFGVSALSNNTFVALFPDQATTYPVFEIYNADLSIAVAKTVVSANVGHSSSISMSVAALNGGGFVVVFIKNSDTTIWFARYNNSGVLQGAVTQFGGYTGKTFCNVTALTGGGFVVSCWANTSAIVYGVYDATSAEVKAPAASAQLTITGTDTCCVNRAGGGFAYIASNHATAGALKAFLHDASGTYTATSTLSWNTTCQYTEMRRVTRNNYGIVVTGYIESASYPDETRIYLDTGSAFTTIKNNGSDASYIPGMSSTGYTITMAYSGNEGFAVQYSTSGPTLKIQRVSTLGRGFGAALSIPVVGTVNPELVALTDGSFVLAGFRQSGTLTFYKDLKTTPVSLPLAYVIPSNSLAVTVPPQRLQNIQTLASESTSRLTACSRADGGTLVMQANGSIANSSGIFVGVNSSGVVDTPAMAFAGVNNKTTGIEEAFCTLTGGGYAHFCGSNGTLGATRLTFLDSTYSITNVVSYAQDTISTSGSTLGTVSICATPDGGCFVAMRVTVSSGTIKGTKYSSSGAVVWDNLTIYTPGASSTPLYVSCAANAAGDVFVAICSSTAGNTTGALCRVSSQGSVQVLADIPATNYQSNIEIDVISGGNLAVYCNGVITIYTPSGALLYTFAPTQPSSVTSGGSLTALPSGGFVYGASITSVGISLTRYDNMGNVTTAPTVVSLPGISTALTFKMSVNASGYLTIPYTIAADAVPRVVRVRADALIAVGVAQNNAIAGEQVTIRNSDASGAPTGLPLATAWADKPLQFDHRGLGGVAGFIQGSNALIYPFQATSRSIS